MIEMVYVCIAFSFIFLFFYKTVYFILLPNYYLHTIYVCIAIPIWFELSAVLIKLQSTLTEHNIRMRLFWLINRIEMEL